MLVLLAFFCKWFLLKKLEAELIVAIGVLGGIMCTFFSLFPYPMFLGTAVALYFGHICGGLPVSSCYNLHYNFPSLLASILLLCGICVGILLLPRLLFFRFFLLLPWFTFWFFVFQFSTLSALGVFLVSFSLTLLVMPRFIAWLQGMSVKQSISFYLDNVGDHVSKSRTPPMGGLVMLIVSFVTFLLFFGGGMNSTVACIMCVGLCFGFLGFMDDYTKVSSGKHFGLLIKIRFGIEVLVATVFLCLLGYLNRNSGDTFFPTDLVFFGYSVNIGFAYFIVRLFAIVGAANGVNITDGLDGLASFPLFLCFAFMAFVAFSLSSVSSLGWHSYPHTKDGVLIAGLCLSVCGSLLGFLWFNAKPAKIFMGDVGSLGLGGMLGAIAVALRVEILLVMSGFLFVMETVSCILQIGYYKATKKRLFLMAPVHHHFEKLGLPETLIVARAWIIALLCLAVSLSLF